MGNNQFQLEEFIEILDKIKEIEPYNLALSSNNQEKEKYIDLLYNFYNQNERHYYSDISLYLYESSEEDLDYLNKNIEILYDYLMSDDILQNGENTLKIRKLLDHIRLERNRNLKLEKKIEEFSLKILNRQTKNISEKLEDNIDKRIKLVDEKFDKINIESITVISIFSAIIMSFFGGFSFFGEALKSINKQTLNETLTVISLVSFSMFNIFYLLFLLIGKIINKPLVSECKKLDCSDCGIFKSFFNKYKINIIVNGIFGILFIVLIKILKSSL